MAVGAAIAGGLASGAVGGLLGGGGSSGDTGPREFNASNDMWKILFNKTKGPDTVRAEARGALGDFQQQQLEGAGLFGEMAQTNAGAEQARTLGLDFLGGLDQFSPQAIAEQQCNQVFPILDKIQQRDQSRLESRLYNQGQLGGTPGSYRTQDLLGSQADARRKLLFDSFGQGLAAQNQQFQLGSGLLQLDPTLRGLFQNLSGANLQNVLGIEQAGINRLLAGASVEGTGGAQGIQSPTVGQQIGAGLLNSGIEGISTGIQGLFNPTSTSSLGAGAGIAGMQGLLP